MARSYWLMKTEPYKYSWDDLKRDGSTYWDGLRNYGARNNLAATKKALGDLKGASFTTTRTRGKRSSASPR